MRPKNTNKIFHSFTEVAAFLGFNVSKEKKPTEEHITKFKSYHLCPNCRKPMVYCGGNIMVCQTEGCKGVPHKFIDKETGEEKVWYTSSYHILDDKGAKLANKLLSNEV